MPGIFLFFLLFSHRREFESLMQMLVRRDSTMQSFMLGNLYGFYIGAVRRVRLASLASLARNYPRLGFRKNSV